MTDERGRSGVGDPRPWTRPQVRRGRPWRRPAIVAEQANLTDTDRIRLANGLEPLCEVCGLPRHSAGPCAEADNLPRVFVNGSDSRCGACGGVGRDTHSPSCPCGPYLSVSTDYSDQESHDAAHRAWPYLPLYFEGGSTRPIYLHGPHVRWQPSKFFDERNIAKEIIDERPGIGTGHLVAEITSRSLASRPRDELIDLLFRWGYKFDFGSLADGTWWSFYDSAVVAQALVNNEAPPGTTVYRQVMMKDELSRSASEREWALRNT